MIHVSAPGKLFLSGEWAILEVGNRGMVAAVDKRVHSKIEEAHEYSINIKDFDIKDLRFDFVDNKVTFSTDVMEIKDKIKFIKESIEVALRYITENGKGLKKFKIETWGELSQIVVDGEAKKIGFGSSAASVVAVVTSVLKLHDMNYTEDEIYKLSTIVHYYAQGKIGSAFDVAASTYGGVFVYSRFDPKWLEGKMKENILLKNIVNDKWPGFVAEKLEVPNEFILLVGWTKKSASTSAMVKQLNQWRDNNKEKYDKQFERIALSAIGTISTWKGNDRNELFRHLKENETLLKDLGEMSGVDIETGDLKKLSEAAFENGGAGKLSGAGGGDCGIAICYDKATANKIKDAWKNAGIYILDVGIDRNGVR
ncbi:phosphomevalonate kinase [Candidatus Aenigmatarchaeota archaeon]